MLKRKNDSLYLVTFLITSTLICFTCTYFVENLSIQAYLIIAVFLTILLYSIMMLLYRFFKKRRIHAIYSSYLAQGNYKEVASQIDSDSKEMEYLWEFKLLALFHSGNTTEFSRLYRTYMNEINECATLERYQICLIHDLLVAVESNRKPVRFLKHSNNTRHKYTKDIEYQLYHTIYMGLKEYYQPQRNLVKVYFEKFLQQTEVISKPLNFYLYYLMTLTMFEGNHPLCKPYVNQTQSYIYDEISLQLVNVHIIQRMNEVQKGLGSQENMDRERNRNNYLNDIEMDSTFDKSYHMEETGFRTTPQAEEGFIKKRHASEFQSDFDALNASVQNGNAFSLYEEHEFDEIAPRQQRTQQTSYRSVQEDEINVDLDPTWFARSTLNNDEPTVTANYSMRNPRIQNSMQTPNVQERSQSSFENNSMHQDPFLNSSTYQDSPIPPTYSNTVQEEPTFMNKRTYPDATQQPTRNLQSSRLQQPNRQVRNPMANQNIPTQPMQQRFPNQMNQQQIQPASSQPSLGQNMQVQHQRTQNPTMMQQNPATTSQDRFSRFQQASTPSPNNEFVERTTPIVQPVKQKRFARSDKSNGKQDPFGFENPNVMGKEPFLHDSKSQTVKNQPSPRKEITHQASKNEQTQTTFTHSYRKFIKTNMVIAGMTLLNGIIMSIASSSFVYTQFFNRYPINSDIIMDIVFLASLIALMMTYLIAGIHTGWTILKKPIASWSIVAKCLTSPFLLIASLLLGAICEIPYVIYATIKANKEKATQ